MQLVLAITGSFVTGNFLLSSQIQKYKHLNVSVLAQEQAVSPGPFFFTSMVVRLHSWLSANQPSPFAHWFRSMSWMLTSTRITPLTQKHTHTHRRKVTEIDVCQSKETRVAPNIISLIRIMSFFLIQLCILFAETCMAFKWTSFQMSDFIQLCCIKHIFYSTCWSNLSPECYGEGHRSQQS